jgi:hypothetical protein
VGFKIKRVSLNFVNLILYPNQIYAKLRAWGRNCMGNADALLPLDFSILQGEKRE